MFQTDTVQSDSLTRLHASAKEPENSADHDTTMVAPQSADLRLSVTSAPTTVDADVKGLTASTSAQQFRYVLEESAFHVPSIDSPDFYTHAPTSGSDCWQCLL